jgi:hypothetical protein
MTEGRTSSGDHQPAGKRDKSLAPTGQTSRNFVNAVSWFFSEPMYFDSGGGSPCFWDNDHYKRKWLAEKGFGEHLKQYDRVLSKGHKPSGDLGVIAFYLAPSWKAEFGETPTDLWHRAMGACNYELARIKPPSIKPKTSSGFSSQGTAAPVAAPYFVGNPDGQTEYVENPDGPPKYDPWRIPTSRKRSKKSGAPKPRPRRDHIPAKTEYRVFKRDQGKCSVCGKSAPEAVIHIDHIVPVSKGGKSTYANLQLLCDRHNYGKGAWDETDWRTQP